MMNGKFVYEEAVDWDPPGDPIQFDAVATTGILK
jgi:hypothetical protein